MEKNEIEKLAMGINLRTQTIKTLLESKLDIETFEEISELLDDIRILSDAKDVVIKEWAGHLDTTSENSLQKHVVMESVCPNCKDLDIEESKNNFWFCNECGWTWQTVL